MHAETYDVEADEETNLPPTKGWSPGNGRDETPMPTIRKLAAGRKAPPIPLKDFAYDADAKAWVLIGSPM